MKLRFQKRALGQIDKALGYIAARSPQGAAKVETRLTAMLLLLQQQPHIGSKTRIPGVRRAFLIPFPYLIDDYVGDDEIVIQRFATPLDGPDLEPAPLGPGGRRHDMIACRRAALPMHVPTIKDRPACATSWAS